MLKDSHEKACETFVHICEVKGAMKSLDILLERGHFPEDVYRLEHQEQARELQVLQARFAAENA